MECVNRNDTQLDLTCAQELIKDSFLWLWEMKELISERPNIVPVGIGNNTSDINMSGYTNGFNLDVGDESSQLARTEGTEEIESGGEEGEDAIVGRDEIEVMAQDDDTNPGRLEHGRSDTKKTGARPGKSNPAAQRESKKAKVIDRFSDVAKAEEQTMQKQLEVKRRRVEGQTQAAIAKIKAQAEIQLQRDRLKAEARKEAKRQEHELQMAELT